MMLLVASNKGAQTNRLVTSLEGKTSHYRREFVAEPQLTGVATD